MRIVFEGHRVACIGDRTVTAESLVEHPQKERDFTIYVVVDTDLRLAGV